MSTHAEARACEKARPKRRLADNSSSGAAGRVVEDEQEDAVEDEEIVREEDLSGEEADSAGPVKWVVPAWEVLANDRVGWRGGLKSLRVSGCE
jgi:hypothetical protein